MRRSIFFLTLCLFYLKAHSQKYTPKEYLTVDYQLLVENDAFTFDIYLDEYYTSGIFPQVRFLKDSIKNTKVIRSYQLNQRMYTPSDVDWKFEEELDRPYAGVLSFSIGNEYYFLSNQYLKVQVELGWMGPASGVGNSQETWHRWFGMTPPMGWRYQIANSPVINLNLSYIKSLVYYDDFFEIDTESKLAAGTVYNYLQENLVMRLGQLKPINQSAYTASSLGKPKPQFRGELSELYFFYSPGLEYVGYNATIQGQLIGKNSEIEFTDKLVPWVFQNRAGMMLSWTRFDMGVIAYWRTHENEKAHNHRYVGIRLNQRF